MDTDALDDALESLTTPKVATTESTLPEPTSGTHREGYVWMQDCFWVYENLGSKITRAKSGTPARWALFQMAKKDTGYFMMQILPKALLLLEKAREKGADGDMVVKEEEKEIRSLQKLLKEAVKEAVEHGG